MRERERQRDREQYADRDEVLLAFAHLATVDVEVAGVEEVVHPLLMTPVGLACIRIKD
jgi:hypothetical protein